MRSIHVVLLAVAALSCGSGSLPRTTSLPSWSWLPPRADGADIGPAVPQLQSHRPKPSYDDIRALKFTQDGRTLLALDSSVVVFAFDPEHGEVRERGWFGFEPDRDMPSNGRLQATVEWAEAHPAIHAFDVSRDGRWVVAGSGKGALGVWELTPDRSPPARLVSRLEGAFKDVQALAFTPDGTRIVAGGAFGDDAVVRLLRFEPNKEPALHSVAYVSLGERSLHGPYALEVAPHGKLAAVVARNYLFSLLAIGADDLTVARRLEADDTLEDVRFTPDGGALVTTGFDHTVRVWDVSTDGTRAQLHHVLGMQAGKTREIALAPDARWLAAGSHDGEVTLWPLGSLRDDAIPTPVHFRPHGDQIAYGLAVHPSWPWLVTAGNELKVWRVNRRLLAQGVGMTKRVAIAKRALPWSGSALVTAAFRPNGELVAVDANGEVTGWRVDRDPAERRVIVASAGPQRDGPRRVTGAHVAADAVFLGYQGGDLAIVTAAGAVVPMGPAHDGHAVRAIVAAGPCVASGAADGGVILWKRDAAKLAKTGRIESGGERVSTLALAPDARTLMTSAATGARTTFRAQHIDATTCTPLGDPTPVFASPTPFGSVGHTGSNPDGQETPITAAFSADGTWLLTGGRDGGAATLWSTADGITQRQILAGHLYGVFAVAFAPSGRHAVTAGTCGTTLLWRFDPSSGHAERIEYLPNADGPPSGFPEAIAWSADGRRVCVGGGHAQSGRLWCYELARGQ